METKITIDQLKNYLGYGLKLEVEGEIRSLYGLYNSKSMIRAETENSYMELSEIKPICYRLSDLDKLIPELGFVPIIQIAKFVDNGHHSEKSKIQKYPNRIKVFTDNCDDVENVNFNITNNSTLGAVQRGYENCYASTIKIVFDQLFKWHFWPFGDEYFDNGLLIDKLKHGYQN